MAFSSVYDPAASFPHSSDVGLNRLSSGCCCFSSFFSFIRRRRRRRCRYCFVFVFCGGLFSGFLGGFSLLSVSLLPLESVFSIYFVFVEKERQRQREGGVDVFINLPFHPPPPMYAVYRIKIDSPSSPSPSRGDAGDEGREGSNISDQMQE